MIADAVIFDKDGTLIDFDAFWVTVSVKAIEDVLRWSGNCRVTVSDVLEAFGVSEGITDIEGALCKGTYAELGHIFYKILKKHGTDIPCDEVTEALTAAYGINAGAGEVKPTSEALVRVLGELKRKGKRLAVVTTDNPEITSKCLCVLGIEELFDKVYTDDGKTPTKPDPYCVYDFCETFGIEKERVVMVGDTMTDMNFAKNAGISAIGVAKSDKNKQILAPHAHTVVHDPSYLLKVLD